MFSSVVGHSEEPDADAAVEEIVQQCKSRLNGTVPSAGLLFAAIDFDHQALLSEITRAFPGTRRAAHDGAVQGHPAQAVGPGPGSVSESQVTQG